MSTSKPAVVFVSTYPPEHCGIGRDTFLLAQSLRDLRDVRVLGNLVEGGALEEGNTSRVWRKNDPRYPLRIVARIDRRSTPPDTIVHVHHHFNLYGGPPTVLLFPLLLFLLRIRGYRVVVHLHSVVDPTELADSHLPDARRFPPGWVARGLRLFYRAVGLLGDRVVVCTASMRRLLIDQYGLDSKQVWVMPVGWWGVAAGRDESEAKRALGLEDHRVIMFHSFLDPTKGLDDLLEAFARIHAEFPDTRLVLAGEVAPHSGDAGQQFERSLREEVVRRGLTDAVTFTGYLDETRLTQVLAAADLFVLPYTMLASLGGSGSLSRLAGFGKPLVASRISRFADEIADGETGLLVTPGSPDEIAAALRRVLSDPTLAQRLGRNLRQLAESRTWRASAELLDRTIYPSLSTG